MFRLPMIAALCTPVAHSAHASLDAGDRNTQGGMSFEALRIGLRVYF